MTDLSHNHGFWENCEKNFIIFLDFGGVHGPSSRFFERAPTFTNFWRLDSCRTSLGLQFEPYVGLGVAWAEKLLRSYEKITTKIKNLRSKKGFVKFREYVSRTLLQGLQPPTKVSLISNRFPKTLGSALLSLLICKIHKFTINMI